MSDFKADDAKLRAEKAVVEAQIDTLKKTANMIDIRRRSLMASCDHTLKMTPFAADPLQSDQAKTQGYKDGQRIWNCERCLLSVVERGVVMNHDPKHFLPAEDWEKGYREDRLRYGW